MTERGGPLRSPCRAVIAVALTAVLAAPLAACAAMPTSGPVNRGRDLPVEPQNAGVPFIAEPPRRGASPTEIVQGFLRASADFRGDHGVARLYLTAAARQGWNPDAGTSVFEGAATTEQTGEAEVVVRASQVAQVDDEGVYRRTPEDSAVTRAFRLSQVDGQWRIAALDDGLLLSSIDVREAYRQVALYFVGPTRTSLVPDVVLLPQLPGATTQLVSRLLRGPTRSLRSAVTSAFPQGTGLDVASVPVRDGLATVQLDRAALRADDSARERMSAQLVWTLKQLGPEISRVRILAGGEDLLTSGVAAEQPRDAWGSYAPDPLTGDVSAYAVNDGVVGRVIEDDFEPLAGPTGTLRDVRTPAVSSDGTRLAVVSSDGRRLLAGRIGAEVPPEPIAVGRDLARPSWDRLGNLWFLDRSTGQVWLLPEGSAEPVPVALPRLPGGSVSAVAVSRDGARVALVSGSGPAARFLVGAVQGLDLVRSGAVADGAGQVAVANVTEVLPGLRGVRDLAWADATTVVVLGSRDGLRNQPLFISIDGYEVTEVEPLEGLVRIAAAPAQPQQQPLIGATADGRLVAFRSGEGWLPLGPGADPAYPG